MNFDGSIAIDFKGEHIESDGKYCTVNTPNAQNKIFFDQFLVPGLSDDQISLLRNMVSVHISYKFIDY